MSPEVIVQRAFVLDQAWLVDLSAELCLPARQHLRFLLLLFGSAGDTRWSLLNAVVKHPTPDLRVQLLSVRLLT